MTMKKFVKIATVAAFAVAAVPMAYAQETIKIGVIAAFSGPFADYGKQMEGGIKAYMKQHGDSGRRQEGRVDSSRTPPARRPRSPNAWRRNWSRATRSTSSPASA
jgi:hypothetical protein